MAAKMYNIFIPKYQGEAKNILVDILGKYCEIYGPELNIFSAPGYLSRTENTIESFVKHFKGDIARKNVSYLFYLDGMNAKAHMTKGTKIIIESLCESMEQSPKIQAEYVKGSCKKDHRKMIFFFKGNTPGNEWKQKIYYG